MGPDDFLVLQHERAILAVGSKDLIAISPGLAGYVPAKQWASTWRRLRRRRRIFDDIERIRSGHCIHWRIDGLHYPLSPWRGIVVLRWYWQRCSGVLARRGIL